MAGMIRAPGPLYENAGFRPSPLDPLVYMLRFSDARAAFAL